MAKIMIVDDAPYMRLLLRDFLFSANHEIVAEATNGVEAVQLYKLHRPDLVTMDMTMPEKDGISALKEIREFDSSAKVIMCSAMGQKQMVLDAILAGAKDFIVKPFQKEMVINAISRAL
ncbi:response regulator [Paenibacillus albiflavus]|uniref:Response regulator n=1 Tax=Paenibacillus albiflavus TaxID=2545760 RepID=A0A4R4EFK4_9BACL|nr:response regulator [Paenibacillus albiflavus]TCZ78834.1 response regulator [Paenibacillus albiflavus]